MASQPLLLTRTGCLSLASSSAVRAECVGSRVGLEACAVACTLSTCCEQAEKAGALDGHAEHFGVAVAEDARRAHATLLSVRPAPRMVFRERCSGAGTGSSAGLRSPAVSSSDRARRAAKRRPARVSSQNGLVAFARAHRGQARVVDLLVAPQQAQALALKPGNSCSASSDDAVARRTACRRRRRAPRAGLEQRGSSSISCTLFRIARFKH